MTGNRNLIRAWKLLFFLTFINYQVVVIILNDFVLFKFLRDLVLIYILLQTFTRKPGVVKIYLPALILLVPFLALGACRSDGLGTALVNLRKYLFPIGVLLAARMFPDLQKSEKEELFGFCVNTLTLLALWGIFQAHILKDAFLIKLGYPTIYSYAYKRTTLNYSFYFGNLGIQRVTATLSNSNVFGIILGITLLTVIIRHKQLLCKPVHWLRLLCLAAGYLLTVSRSNYLAMLVVVFLLLWRFVPHKGKLVFAGGILLVGFLVLYLVQDDSGITHKLMNWVIESLTGTESSAAGRDGIWTAAWERVKQTPWGIGFGKTGSQASGAGEMYSCENSYLAMALDMGWFGCLSYLLLELSVIWELYTQRSLSPSSRRLGISTVIYFIFICFFSNHIYDMEAISYVYFLVGLTANVTNIPVKQSPAEEATT